MSEKILPGLPDADVRAFLAAIKADPENDTPRLVFADYLQECEHLGLNKAAKSCGEWAQYIRDEIAFAQCPRTDPRYWELRGRCKPYWEHHTSAKAMLPKFLQRRGAVTYHRGFPDQLDISPRNFISNAEQIAECPAPLVAARFSQAGPSARQIFDQPVLRQIQRLSLDASGYGPLAERLATCSHVAGVRSLTLSECRANGLKAIATSDHLANLRKLHFGRIAPGADGLSTLASSETMAQLEELVLGGDFDTELLNPLCASVHLQNLRVLKTWTRSGGGTWLQPLLDGALPNLRELHVRVHSPDPTLGHLLASSRLGSLTVLELTATPLEPEQLAAIPECDAWAHLCFQYHGHSMDTLGSDLVHSPLMSHCVGLDFTMVRMSEADLIALAESPRVRGLRLFRLYPRYGESSPVTDLSARRMAESPHLADLTEFEVYDHEMTDVGLDALAAGTFANSLKRLQLNAGNLSRKRVLQLASPEQFPNLVSLYVGYPFNSDAEVRTVLRERFG